MTRKLPSKRKCIRTSVANTPSLNLPLSEPSVSSPGSLSGGALANPQETAVAPELLCLEDVTSWLNVYNSIMQHTSPLLHCSFSFDLAYSVLHHESVLGDIIPRQKNKRMPRGNGGGIFFFSRSLNNYNEVGTGLPVSFSGNKVHRFSATFGLCEMHNDNKATSGLSGRQYQLLDRNGNPFGPCLIIAFLDSNQEWVKSKRPVDDFKRAPKRARAGNCLDVSSISSISRSSTSFHMYALTPQNSAMTTLANVPALRTCTFSEANGLPNADSTDSDPFLKPPSIPPTAEPVDFQQILNTEWGPLNILPFDDDFDALSQTYL